MPEQGPIPLFVHGVIEYVAAVLFLLAPFVFGFESTAAATLAVMLGLGVFLLAATTSGPSGIVYELPLSVHLRLDYGLAALLIVAPFVFMFFDEAAPTIFFILLGVVHLLITLGTRFVWPGEEPERGP